MIKLFVLGIIVLLVQSTHQHPVSQSKEKESTTAKTSASGEGDNKADILERAIGKLDIM